MYTEAMSFAPKHNFQLFDDATSFRRTELAMEATPTEKANRFASLVAVGKAAGKPNVTIHDVRERWIAEKVSIRQRQLAAFKRAGGKS